VSPVFHVEHRDECAEAPWPGGRSSSPYVLDTPECESIVDRRGRGVSRIPSPSLAWWGWDGFEPRLYFLSWAVRSSRGDSTGRPQAVEIRSIDTP
jgi:hypothetical protein